MEDTLHVQLLFLPIIPIPHLDPKRWLSDKSILYNLIMSK